MTFFGTSFIALSYSQHSAPAPVPELFYSGWLCPWISFFIFNSQGLFSWTLFIISSYTICKLCTVTMLYFSCLLV